MNARILVNSSEKFKGVIGREKLEPDEIYVFMHIDPHQGFHMNGVKFPIEIAFIDKDAVILDINAMEAQSGTSKAPEGTILAVEASKGYFDAFKLRKGDFWKEIFNIITKVEK